MKRNSHGGPRPTAGRPATTASPTTRPVSFRLGAEGYASLERAAGKLSIGQKAKRIVLEWLR